MGKLAPIPNDAVGLIDQKARTLGVPDAIPGAPSDAVANLNKALRKAGLPDAGPVNEPLNLFIYENASVALPATTGPANAITFYGPSSSVVATANQKPNSTLLAFPISDEKATVRSGILPIFLQAPGLVSAQVWTHAALALQLDSDGAGNFTGNLDISAEPNGPLNIEFRAYDKPAGDGTYTLYLTARMTLFVTGGRDAIIPFPAGAAGMTLKWSDEFTKLSSARTKPGSGQWTFAGPNVDASASDGFTWFENGIFWEGIGLVASEHTGTGNNFNNPYNPFKIQGSFLRTRTQYDPNYTDPYGTGYHWYTGFLSSAFPDGTFNTPPMGNGYYEARMLTPDSWATQYASTGGTWPAFWMNSYDGLPVLNAPLLEIDVMEMYGHDNAHLQIMQHVWFGATGFDGAIYSGSPEPPVIGNMNWDFHRYGVKINGNTVTGYLDDVVMGTCTLAQLPSGLPPGWFLYIQQGLGYAGDPILAPPATYYDLWTDYVRYYAATPTLATLTMTGTLFLVGQPQGSVIGSVLGLTLGSVLTISDNHSGAFQLASTNVIQVGPTPPAAGTYNIGLTETLPGATGSPKVTTIPITIATGIGASVQTFLGPGTQGYNLSFGSPQDWAAFGYNVNAASIERKATGGSKISVLAQVGAVALNNFNNTAAPTIWKLSWTDGSPDTAISNEGWIVYCAASAVGTGMSFTVPADTTIRTIKVYLICYSPSASAANAKLTATLSDGSAGPYVDTSVSVTNQTILARYTIVYKAGIANQTLTVAWTNNTTNSQQVQISGVVLQ